MKTCAVVFTYPGDYPKAIRLTKHIKKFVDDVFFCIESKDKDVPLPKWVTPLVADFDRCVQLHGTQAIIGIKAVFNLLVEKGYDGIIKLDSDTLVFRPEQFIKPLELGSDFVYIRRIAPAQKTHMPRRANGCCYALSAKAVKELNKVNASRFDEIMYTNDRHEDLVFSNLFVDACSISIHDVDKSKVWWAALPYRQPDCIAGHFGYCDIKRIKREVNLINPLFFDEVFSEENEKDVKIVEDYCHANNIKMKEYKDLYSDNGQLISKIEGQLPENADGANNVDAPKKFDSNIPKDPKDSIANHEQFKKAVEIQLPENIKNKVSIS